MGPIENGLFVFVLGMIVIFTGMIIIILAVSLCGKLLNSPVKEKKSVEVQQQIVENDEDIEEHIKVAIVAVISQYYFNQKSTCDFKVKKIKRI